MTILAVDDEPLVLMLVASVLEDNGYEVLTADSGPKAIALFRQHSEDVDLLISDIVMPGMDGPSLAAELKRQRPDLGVLLMSGYCEPEQLSHGYEFLAKPFALPDMLEKVRAMVRAQHRAAPPVQIGKTEAATAGASTRYRPVLSSSHSK